MRQHFRIIVSTVAVFLLIAPTAGAITFGQIDGFDGHPHPNVGCSQVGIRFRPADYLSVLLD